MRRALPPFTGPFRGLNTTAHPRELGPAEAVDAKNIILGSAGRIRPRAPLAPLQDPPNYLGVGNIVSAIMWESPAAGPVVIFKVMHEGAGYGLYSIPANWDPQSETRQLRWLSGHCTSPYPATWVLANNMLYVLDGSARIVKTDGSPSGTLLAGIPAPGAQVRIITDGVPVAGAISITAGQASANEQGLGTDAFSWAFTHYDADHLVESNPVYSPEIQGTGTPVNQGLRIGIQFDDIIPPYHGVTHRRIYRKNLSKGQTFWRLVQELAVDQIQVFDPPGTAIQPAPEISTVDTGPFAPSRNGVPQFATVGCMYKDRLFRNSIEQGKRDQIFYSAIGKPDHCDGSDYENLPGDELSGVSGLAELAGQLAIGKRNSIWILSGSIIRPTNDTVALGVTPDPPMHELYRTKCRVGCANYPGPNGFVVCGHPPLLYFNSEHGYFRFDGVDEHNVAMDIQPTWENFVRRPTPVTGWERDHKELIQRITYAVDAGQDVIYLCQQTQEQGEPQILVYHFRLGAWTYLSVEPQYGPPSCVATAVGDWDEGQSPGEERRFAFGSALLVATQSTAELPAALLLSNDRAELPMPEFRYETGRMALAEGRKQHIYEMTWLLTQPPRPQAGDPPRQIRLGFRCDGEDDETLKTVEVSGRSYVRQGVSREVGDISLILTNAAEESIRWHKDFGVAGWIFEAELAGR